jgi:hypothetical protein
MVTYKKRVYWSEEEENILKNALEERVNAGKNINIVLLCKSHPELEVKYSINPRLIGNKLASLKNGGAMVYKDRTKWTKEEEDILIEAIKESRRTGKHIPYGDVAKKSELLMNKFTDNVQIIKNKVGYLRVLIPKK